MKERKLHGGKKTLDRERKKKKKNVKNKMPYKERN